MEFDRREYKYLPTNSLTYLISGSPVWIGKVSMIRIPNWGLKQSTILHELAHVFVRNLDMVGHFGIDNTDLINTREADKHGRVFCRILIELVKEFMTDGQDYAANLEVAFDHRKVNYDIQTRA